MMMSQPEKRQENRTILWGILHNGRGRTGTVFTVILILVILVSSSLIPLEFLVTDDLPRNVIAIMEAIVVGLFTVEYALRIYSAPNRLRYIFSFFGVVDLLSIMPFYPSVFGSPLVRLILLVRLVKLCAIEAAAQVADAKDMARGIGLTEGEKVEYVVTKSAVALIIGIIAPLFSLTFGLGILLLGQGIAAIAGGITLILFTLIFLLKAWIDFSYDVIYVTNYRLIFQNQHLLGRSVNQIGYNAVTNVKPYYPHPISYLLRYGTLVIDTAADHPGQIQLHTVRRHEQAAHFIMQKAVAAQHNQGAG